MLAKSVFLVLLALSTLTFKTVAQDSAKTVFSQLAAVKAKEKQVYPLGTKLVVRYGSDSAAVKVKGTLTEVTERSIRLQPNREEDLAITIPITDLSLVKKINPRSRIIRAIIGTALIGGSLIFINSEKETPRSAMRTTLSVPVIGAGFFLLYSIPMSLSIERFNTRTRQKGWKFLAF